MGDGAPLMRPYVIRNRNHHHLIHEGHTMISAVVRDSHSAFDYNAAFAQTVNPL